MEHLSSAIVGTHYNELKQRFFSAPLPQSATLWEQLAASQILDGIPAGVAFLDENLILRYQNKTYAAYLDNFTVGKSQSAEGRCFFDLLPGSRHWTENSLRYVKDSKSNLIEHHHEINLKDGQTEQQTFWNANLTPMIHSNGRFAGVVIVCQESSFEKRMIDQLKKTERQVDALTRHLEDAKKAIRFLTDMRIEDQQRIHNNIADNLNSAVFPLLEKVKKSSLKASQKNALDVVYKTLANLTKASMNPSQLPNMELTPKETMIYNMIKAGKTTKEIADIMCLSPATVSYHRSKIRKKRH